MAEVVLEHLSKVYPNGVVALRDLNLHVADGELVVLVGPSGSGKTTTLRLIAGLEQPSHGSLRIGGRVVNTLPPRDRDVALVFQRHTLYPQLTVRRNLSFGIELRDRPFGFLGRLLRRAANGMTQRQIEQRVAEAAQLLELEDVLERKPSQLSGGQQQRVALGRAVVRRPAVFLLDEPLSHLDFKLRSGLRRQLHLLHRRLPATMIYVTHDPTEAMILADRVVVLDQGAALQVDRPLTVYDRPCNRQVAGFFGWPLMNFIDGLLSRGDEGLVLATADAVWPVPASITGAWSFFQGKPVTVGVRPQHLRVIGGDESPRQGPCLEMQVVLVEALGSTTLLTLQRGGLQLTAQRDGRTEQREGQTMRVVIDMDRVHLFDRATGEALVHGRPEG